MDRTPSRVTPAFLCQPALRVSGAVKHLRERVRGEQEEPINGGWRWPRRGEMKRDVSRRDIQRAKHGELMRREEIGSRDEITGSEGTRQN
jgi:hypothetical protein